MPPDSCGWRMGRAALAEICSFAQMAGFVMLLHRVFGYAMFFWFFLLLPILAHSPSDYGGGPCYYVVHT